MVTKHVGLAVSYSPWIETELESASDTFKKPEIGISQSREGL